MGTHKGIVESPIYWETGLGDSLLGVRESAKYSTYQLSSAQLLSRVRIFATP